MPAGVGLAAAATNRGKEGGDAPNSSSPGFDPGTQRRRPLGCRVEPGNDEIEMSGTDVGGGEGPRGKNSGVSRRVVRSSSVARDAAIPSPLVIPGLDPGTHTHGAAAWVAGSNPAMTSLRCWGMIERGQEWAMRGLAEREHLDFERRVGDELQRRPRRGHSLSARHPRA